MRTLHKVHRTYSIQSVDRNPDGCACVTVFIVGGDKGSGISIATRLVGNMEKGWVISSEWINEREKGLVRFHLRIATYDSGWVQGNGGFRKGSDLLQSEGDCLEIFH